MMRPQVRSPTAPAVLGRQLQVVHLHHPPYPLVVIAGAKVVVDQCRHAPMVVTVATRRAISYHLPNLLQHDVIFLATVEARAGAAFSVGAATAGA